MLLVIEYLFLKVRRSFPGTKMLESAFALVVKR